MAIFQREPPPPMGASDTGGLDRNRDSDPISLHAVNAVTGQVLSRRVPRRRQTMFLQVVTLIAGSKRRSLLMAGDDDEMFMTRSLNATL